MRAGVEHETQADEQAGEEEERQQRGVVAGDVPDLRLPGRRILQLQRVERIGRGEVVADGGRQHERRRQGRHQRRRPPGERIAPQRQHHAAQREAHHHDGDDPVAILRPLRDGEVARQRGLVSHGGERDEKQRDEIHGQTNRSRNRSVTLLKRAGSSTNRAWPASLKMSISVSGRFRTRFSPCATQRGRTTYSSGTFAA